MIPVEGHPNLYRDPESGAIINYDNNEYNKYMAQVKLKKREKEELSTLKKEVSEIKDMMNKILVLLNDK